VTLRQVLPTLAHGDSPHGGAAYSVFGGERSRRNTSSVVRSNRFYFRLVELRVWVRDTLRGVFWAREFLRVSAATVSIAARSAFWSLSRWVEISSDVAPSSDHHAALADHVLGVVAQRPQEQMVRSAARRVVAVVQDAHIVGDGTVGQLPSDTVRTTEHAATSDLANEDDAVTAPCLTTCPKPTAARAVDLFPETFGERSRRHHGAGIIPRHLDATVEVAA
jgi:hypothetical protein